MSVGGRAGKRLRDDEDGLGGGIEAGWGGAGLIEAGLGISMTFFELKNPEIRKSPGKDCFIAPILHFTHNYSLKY